MAMLRLLPILLILGFVVVVLVMAMNAGAFDAIDRAVGTGWRTFLYLACWPLGFWALTRWKDIVTALIRACSPHPAEQVVQAALANSIELDGDRLAQLLGELPGGSRLFREVRLAQASELVAQLEAAARDRERALRQKARQGQADELDRLASIESQNAIGQAAIALERAKAAFSKAQELRRTT